MASEPIHVYAHRYPSILLTHPQLIYLSYWLNYLLLLRKWYLAPTIKRLIREQGRSFQLLDAGVGEGQFFLPFAKHYSNAHFTGIDKWQPHFEFCNAFIQKLDLENVDVRSQALEELCDKDRFDIVLCIAVLQYVKDDLACMENLSASMKENGKLLLYVPVNNHTVLPWYRHFTDRYVNYETIQQRQRIYTEPVLDNLLQNTGFIIQKKVHTYGVCGRVSSELLNSITMLYNHYKRPVRYLFPLVLVMIYPLFFLLMIIDLVTPKRSGNGIMILAQKRTV